MASDRELVVTGEGSALGTPDRCSITLALNVMAETTADALDRAGALTEQVIGLALQQGVDRANVQTLDISLHDWLDKDSHKVTARVATYVLSIGVPGVKAGRLLAAVAPVGGESLQIRGIRLSVDDPRQLAAEARRKAVEDALAKAHELADAAGVRLGRITSIDDGGALRSRSARFETRGAVASAATPLEPGTSAVTAHVTITMKIKD